MKRFEMGAFLPVARNGFLKSTNAPPYYPSYRDNLDITLLAEEIGLDYVFSMSKWRGTGGRTHYWDASLESVSLMSALAAMTKRIALIATVNPVIFHPVLTAKMTATIDDISRGRLGLNLITGAILAEYGQMGVLPEGYDQNRYECATEWLQVLKQLWTEPSVTYEGKYFHLQDCVSEPKPVRKPHPFIVCAGTSDTGLRFTGSEADYSFLSGKDLAAIKEKSLQVKAVAAEKGRTIKTAMTQMVVVGDTKADAEAYWAYLLDGADVDAISNIAAIQSHQSSERARSRGAEYLADNRKIVSKPPIIGGPGEVAEAIVAISEGEGGLDGVLLTFPDFMDGLRRFGADVMPLLRKKLDVGWRESPASDLKLEPAE